MTEFTSHVTPPYSEEAREDALFHYTTASGLIGILRNAELWSTAYYCANDESELVEGKGVLLELFWNATGELLGSQDQLIRPFSKLGIDVFEVAKRFEQVITQLFLNQLCAYITCFCKPVSQEDFTHGLLSQWRGYGADGGYALQFSKNKLHAEIENAHSNGGFNYELHNVYYNQDNELKLEVLEHREAFLDAYRKHLYQYGKVLEHKSEGIPNPIGGLFDGPLEALLNYLIHTKNKHFSEENECRLSLLDFVANKTEILPVGYFNRNGLLVPYKKTPKASFDVLKCVEGIVIGPSSRMTARLNSVSHLVKQLGLNIPVWPSSIPFVRT